MVVYLVVAVFPEEVSPQRVIAASLSEVLAVEEAAHNEGRIRIGRGITATIVVRPMELLE